MKRTSEVVINPATIGTGHLTLGGAICNRVYRHTCEHCGDKYENTVPWSKSCPKRECIKKRDAASAARKRAYQKKWNAKQKARKVNG